LRRIAVQVVKVHRKANTSSFLLLITLTLLFSEKKLFLWTPPASIHTETLSL